MQRKAKGFAAFIGLPLARIALVLVMLLSPLASWPSLAQEPQTVQFTFPKDGIGGWRKFHDRAQDLTESAQRNLPGDWKLDGQGLVGSIPDDQSRSHFLAPVTLSRQKLSVSSTFQFIQQVDYNAAGVLVADPNWTSASDTRLGCEVSVRQDWMGMWGIVNKRDLGLWSPQGLGRDIALNTTYKLTLEIDGTTVRCLLDGQEVLKKTVPDLASFPAQVSPALHVIEAQARFAELTAAGVISTAPPPPALTPTPGLIAYWKFNEASGDTASDSSGQGNHATVRGASWTSSGRFGNALAFDGVDDYVLTPVRFSQLTNGLTWMAWVKHDNPTGNWSWIFSEDSLSDAHSQIGKYKSTAHLRFELRGVGTIDTSAEHLGDGQWHHVAGVWEKTIGLRIYIDSVLRASGSMAGSLTAQGAIRIGAKNDSLRAEKWRGAIDEARIYNIVMSQAEIQAAMAGEVAPTPTEPPRPTAITLLAEERLVKPNGTVSLPIRLERASRIGSMNFSLRYDPAVVRVNRVDPGDLIGGALFQASTREVGIIRFGLAISTADGITGEGPLAYVEFQAVGGIGSRSDLVLRDLLATDTTGGRIDLTLRNGRVTIQARLTGDYDGDGRLTAKDALAALKMSVRELEEDLNLDMDGDGRVTAEDARRILGAALAGEGPPPSTPPGATPAQRLLSPTPDAKAASALWDELRKAGLPIQGTMLFVLPFKDSDRKLAVLVLDGALGFRFEQPAPGKDIFTQYMFPLAQEALGIKRVAVVLRDEEGQELINATAPTDALMAYSQGRLSRAQFVEKLEVRFNWAVLLPLWEAGKGG